MKRLFAVIFLATQAVSFQLAGPPRCHVVSTKRATLFQSSNNEDEFDVIVIGAGVGGLSCAALTAKYGMKTLCVEAHDTAGGVAHGFQRYSSASKDTPFCFDSGPSLVSGMSQMGTNPLRQVLDAIGTADEVDWKTYDGWVVHDTSDGTSFKITTGSGGEFEAAIEQKAGVSARREFEDFKAKMMESRGLSESSAYIPPFALRGDVKAAASLAKYYFKLLSIGLKGRLLTGPFSKVMDLYGVNDPFVRKWFDYLSFALSGLDASQTQAAPVAYMMIDLHKEGAVLDYPMGGMDSLVQALASGMQKNGGKLLLNSRVERILLSEDGKGARAEGIVLDDGRVIKARKGVVCNAPLWNMARILEDSIHGYHTEEGAVKTAVQQINDEAARMSMTRSFMHLHLGIPKGGLPKLECHHSVLDLSDDVDAEQNMVIISIPTVFDESLAPDGYHVVHAYSAACDDFNQFEKFLPEGKETGKIELLWKAVERVIPDIRERASRPGSIVLEGTPLTHRRYNQRFRGTYGPAPSPGKDIWELAGSKTKIEGLLACGDTTFPGIGLPGVAASGTIAANTLASLKSQNELINELKRKGALQ